ncbi:MAG: TonB-dependent receptor, partial [Flavobacterium sp.]
MRITFLLLCILAGLSTHAQTGTLTGKVSDKTTKQPIPYVTVSVKEADKIVTGGITDDNGNFEIKNLGLKNYVIEIQFIGYKKFTTTADFSTGQKTVSLGTISLEEESTKLEGVTVVAERSTIEQKIDRKVINVGKDLTTAGATAAEIMNNIPSVNIDQDGKLSLRGNDNVRVLVDGRPTNIEVSQLLKQIPSTSIKKIELITNPSAKYNPEGMSGIINIVLHKNANDGFNASINSGITMAKAPKSNNSINMNYRTGKVNFFGTYGDNFGEQYNDGDIRRLDGDQSHQMIDIVNDNKSHLFKAGMDFYINDKNTISVYTNQNYFAGDGVIDLDVSSVVPSHNLFQQSKYFTHNQDGAYNIAYKKLFAKDGETLDLEINHDYFREVQRGEYATTFAATPEALSLDFTGDRRKLTTANLDFVNPLSDKVTLELGAEARVTRTESNYLTSADDNLQPGETQPAAHDSDYNYDTNIFSAYATYGKKFTKWSYQFGMRLESYKVHAAEYGVTKYEDDYFTFYPSAYLTYTPTEKNMWQISYSRRVDRPSLEQTKPIREFSTPLITSLGNPELNPQFTNSVEVNYTRNLKNGSITGGVFARLIDHQISRVLYPDPANDDPDTVKQILTYDNFENNTAFGFELSANYKITKWWDIQPAVDFSSIRQKGIVSVQVPGTDPQEFEFVEKS